MSGMNAGMNVGRSLIGGSTLNQIDPRRGVADAAPPTLQKAVVIDIIYDFSIFTQDYKDKLAEQVSNFELIEVMPVNSIVAQIVSSGGGNSATPYTILFPFFSSHFMLPLKVGEIVHVIYQDFSTNGNKLGFWLSRVHGQRQVEDVNYSHLDRQYDPLNNLLYWSSTNLKEITSSPDPSFPNGGGTSDTQSIRPFAPNEDAYANIINDASASKIETPESVPRWNKRPQEFVLQGSNNALICLGEDRSGPVKFPEPDEQQQGDVPTNDSKGFAGTIDMVVGRGRFPPEPKTVPELTAARTIQNSRGKIETDKAPFRNKEGTPQVRAQDNPIEGDPDFINDAARLYVTMQSVADNKFGITSINFPTSTLPITQPTNADDIGTINRSYVAGKADHIRFISRKNKEKNIEGTLLFLREGEASTDSDGDKDLSYMFFDKNGINIESNKIFFGTAIHDDPNETSNINYNDDNGPYEPWILWSKYKETVDALQKQITNMQEEHTKAIKDLRDGVAQAFGSMANAFAGGGNSVPYGPNSAVIAGQAAALSAQTSISTKTEQILSRFKQQLGNDQDKNITDNVSKVNHSQKLYGSKGGDS